MTLFSCVCVYTYLVISVSHPLIKAPAFWLKRRVLAIKLIHFGAIQK